MGDLKKLETNLEFNIKNTKKVLDIAKEENYETVVVIGMKDGYSKIHWSGYESRFKIIGMIEDAKIGFINNAGIDNG